jgi:hypothetical protein
VSPSALVFDGEAQVRESVPEAFSGTTVLPRDAAPVAMIQKVWGDQPSS